MYGAALFSVDVMYVKSYEMPNIVATGLFRANFACRKQTDEIVKHFSGISELIKINNKIINH